SLDPTVARYCSICISTTYFVALPLGLRTTKGSREAWTTTGRWKVVNLALPLPKKHFDLCRVWQRPILSPSQAKNLGAQMELHRSKANVRPWGMLIISIGCSIIFSYNFGDEGRTYPAL